jgi:hypothetical protein
VQELQPTQSKQPADLLPLLACCCMLQVCFSMFMPNLLRNFLVSDALPA